MKEAFKHIFRLLLSILLILIAIVLFIIITPCSLIWKICATIKYENRKARNILSGISTFFTEIAASYDQLGNACFGGFFNWLFLQNKELRYVFGDKDETISEVLGWNDRLNALNSIGKRFVKLLDKLDSGHCAKAMESGLFKARTKLHTYNNLQHLI